MSNLHSTSVLLYCIGLTQPRILVFFFLIICKQTNKTDVYPDGVVILADIACSPASKSTQHIMLQRFSFQNVNINHRHSHCSIHNVRLKVDLVRAIGVFVPFDFS